MDLVFRDADPSEDDELARIIYNSFVPIWNHNWFQCLTEPLPIIESTSEQISPLQRRRQAFYRAWIAIVREYHGDVTIAYREKDAPPTNDAEQAIFTESPSLIAAVVLLLPPHARPNWFEPLIAWRSGFLQALVGLGARGMWRTAVTFEGNVHRMIGEGLKAKGIANGNQEQLVFCHGCVRNPQWEGRAPARKLFDWAIRRWWDREVESAKKKQGLGDVKDAGIEKLDKDPRTPVWLDTTIDDGVRAYGAIGFEVVGECMVDTGCDEKGIKLSSNASAEEKERGSKEAKQRVMVRVPPT